MDNYKIKVKDEAESKEAQELLKQLGFQEAGFTGIGLPCYLATWDGGYADYYFSSLSEGRKREELTLPQLRDLVVLKRNDINDANWETEGGDQIFKDSNDKSFMYRSDGWDELQRHEMRQAMWEKPKAIAKPQDPALISGAEALDALKAKKEVEYCGEGLNDSWLSAETLPVVYFLTDSFRFRIKPQTIKVELELPKPFEPKVGEVYWFISPFYSTGYDHCTFANDSADKLHVQYGAYRTEDDVKKAVEQLRKIRGVS